MRRSFYSGLVALVLSSAGCTGDTPAPVPAPAPLAPAPPVPPPVQEDPALGRPFIFVLNDSALFDGMSVAFVEVTENSRCPEERECVWPGRAVVRLRLQKDGEVAEALPEIMGISNEPTPVEALGYRFTLQSLTYYPGTAGVQSTPIATVLVERL